MLLAAKPVVAFDATPEQDLLVEQGVAFYDDEDYAKAKAILLPLAEAGYPKAMSMVGKMIKFGSGFTKDVTLACDWYERSAKAGYGIGMYNLSICYNQGIGGRPKDKKQMLYWRTKGANNGSTHAMINLSSLDKSEGEEYRYWMNMARKNGSVYAKVSLYLQGYEQDVPDLYIQDILCVYIRILLLDGSFSACDK